jgi:hypothetical protein
MANNIVWHILSQPCGIFNRSPGRHNYPPQWEKGVLPFWLLEEPPTSRLEIKVSTTMFYCNVFFSAKL